MSDTLVFEQAAVWVNGTTQLGHVKEFELPELEWATYDHEAIGLRGVQQYPTTLEPMECELTFADYGKELTRYASDPFTAYDIQVRQAYGVFRGGSRVATSSVIVFLKGRFKMLSLGSLSKGSLEKEATLAVDYVKQVVDGETLMEYSVNPPIMKQGGTDILETVRTILGI